MTRVGSQRHNKKTKQDKDSWLFAGVSPQKSGFNSRSVYCGVCGEQSGNETFFSRVFWFPPVGIVPSALLVHSFIIHESNITSETSIVVT